jgi:hypothetical protein
MKEADKIAIELKAKMAAFSTFKEFGIDKVKKNFPDQIDFVLQNEDRNYEDVVNEIESKLPAIN